MRGGIYSSDLVPAVVAYEHHCYFADGAVTFTMDEFGTLSEVLGVFCTFGVRDGRFTMPDGPGELYCPMPA